MSAAFAQSDFPTFTAQTLVEAHHTAVIDETVDPMHAKHVEMMSPVSRRREIALLVYRVVPSLVLIESTRVLHDEHAETTAAVTDCAIAVITDVASCPFTTDEVENPESVMEKLVDGVDVGDAHVAIPFVEQSEEELVRQRLVHPLYADDPYVTHDCELPHQ